MKYALFTSTLFFSLCCSAQSKRPAAKFDSIEYKIYRDSIVKGHENIDTLANRRIRQCMAQFGSKEKFEKFYGKSVEEFRKDFVDEFKSFEKKGN